MSSAPHLIGIMPIFVIGSDPIPGGGARRGRRPGEWRIHEGAGREASASKRWSSAARGTAAEAAVGDEGASVRA